jgi:hypothetical protein
MIHVFLTSALVGGECSASPTCRFNPGERALCILWTGGWLVTRDGLDYVEMRKFLTLPGLELQLHRNPARSQSLYRLHYHIYKIILSPMKITVRPTNKSFYLNCKWVFSRWQCTKIRHNTQHTTHKITHHTQTETQHTKLHKQ